jgi:hypothetical protein
MSLGVAFLNLPRTPWGTRTICWKTLFYMTVRRLQSRSGRGKFLAGNPNGI